jgi:N-acetylmuramic acid 6-phosphate etherase
LDKLTTESSSEHENLEHKSTLDLIKAINSEDHKVAAAVERETEAISKLIDAVFDKMRKGGRLFYIGSGTSGRLGIVDASECPPTYGVDHGLVIGIIAGGDSAIRKAVEFAEDDMNQGWKDLSEHAIADPDVLIGISASGSTPYVLGALAQARKNGILTGGIACNRNSKLGNHADFAVEILVGPEIVTGSTRMKSGTAQKLCLNMISTSLMIKLGRVIGNKMVDMQLSNSKLINRGTQMVMDVTGLDKQKAEELLKTHGSVRAAIDHFEKGNSPKHSKF